METVKENEIITLEPINKKFIETAIETLEIRTHITLTESQLVNKIISNYTNENNYICLFHLTKQIKMSLGELVRLSKLTHKEIIALEYLMMANRRNKEIEAIVRVIKRERGIQSELSSVDGENINVSKLFNCLEKDYDNRYKYTKFKGGIKKLLIKAVAVSYIERESLI